MVNTILIAKVLRTENHHMGSETAEKKKTPSGSERAILESWVDEHSEYLFRFAYRHFPNEANCHELVLETFVAAVQSVKSFQGNSAPRTWLTSILRHKIIDRIRKNTKDQTVSLDELQESGDGVLFDSNEHWTEVGPRDWGMSPEAAVENAELRKVLQDCLGKLPERMKQIFLLREYDGLDREEIGNTLAITPTNVGVILHRARLQLQSCMQANWLKSR